MRAEAKRGAGQTRRGALRLIAGAVAAGWAGVAAAQTCVDPAKLPAGDRSLRRSLNYKASADARRQCGGCAFFSAARAGGCGTCAMLSGGPVAAAAVCDSWAAKS